MISSILDLSNHFECAQGCVDGFILDGWTARECVCQQQRRLNARLQHAMIPEEFERATFAQYRTETSVQANMLKCMQRYLNQFAELLPQQQNGFGFMAAYGESRLRELKGAARAQAKAQHNNFGLGKTHLQIAAAKELIRRGFAVFCISDVAFMDELSRARAYNDDGVAVSRLLESAIRSDVLVWDDIGKAKPSDYRLDMYYQIINERYKAKRPIIFSSNEDSETLSERIGDAAASRLLGMARGNTFTVEGKDFRLTGGERA
ncbi:ATP-binding protein [Paenibacillus albus]|uniref:DNA replication protein n=1 Tax=Paenibacillus albus TaxID=2495582 RepID=A0A3Q8XA77_9BACL|nr:ATP-binding protein [Paenibacillus albus]AZN43971.1 DNA replication protein [Paenibacillus albus]